MKIGVSVWGTCLTESDSSDWLPIRMLIEAGHSIAPVSSGDIDVYIAFEHYPEPARIAAITVPVEKRILVSFEPRTVNPLMYNLEQRSGYGKVLVPSKQHRLRPEEQVYFGGGLTTKEELENHLAKYGDRARKPQSVALINENKFSLVPGSLYTLRSRTVSKFSRAKVEINLAGANWDKPAWWWLSSQAYALLQCVGARQKIDFRLLRLPRKLNAKYVKYSGKVASSVEFQSRFKYSIVIENEASYVTEKLFNAIQAGCVPIYCGPRLEDFGIPTNVAIQTAPSSRAILDAILTTGSQTADEVVSNGRAWIQKPETQNRFGHESSFRRIGQMLVEELQRF